MKILHVITGLNVGGAETMLFRLLENSGQRDLHMEVATLLAPGFVGRKMVAAGVAVEPLGMSSLWTAPAAALRLALLIRRSRPDVIMAWMHHAQLATMLAVALSRSDVPVIWNVRHSLGQGYAQEKRLTRLVLWTQAALSRLPAAIVYNSRAAARQYRAIGFDPPSELVIPNGFPIEDSIDTNSARAMLHGAFGITEGRTVIGMVARAHPMKDVGNLVAAFGLLRCAHATPHLLIVGEGMDRPGPELTQALSRLPPGSWTLAGQRDDIQQWLGGLDMLVLPSAWGEGFPNVIGEAMAKGVPCIGTTVGDMEWIIGATGRCVPPRHPAALAMALQELCAMDKVLRRKLGGAARQRMVELFALDDVIARYESLYHDVAGHRGPASSKSPPVQCEAA